MNYQRLANALLLTVIAGFGLAGCSDGDTKKITSQQQPDPASVSREVGLIASQTSPLGAVVADADGRTLYRSDTDTAAPSASKCDAACAQEWPPVIVASDRIEVEVQGVDRSLVGKIVRADGTTQVTLAGWPLYRFGEDIAPGETNGHGVRGTWFAVNPLGEKVAGKATAADANTTGEVCKNGTGNGNGNGNGNRGDGNGNGFGNGYGNGQGCGNGNGNGNGNRAHRNGAPCEKGKEGKKDCEIRIGNGNGSDGKGCDGADGYTADGADGYGADGADGSPGVGSDGSPGADGQTGTKPEWLGRLMRCYEQ